MAWTPINKASAGQARQDETSLNQWSSFTASLPTRPNPLADTSWRKPRQPAEDPSKLPSEPVTRPLRPHKRWGDPSVQGPNTQQLRWDPAHGIHAVNTQAPTQAREGRNKRGSPIRRIDGPKLLTPSPIYLERTAITHTSIPEPQPLLIILDLNGALIYRPKRSGPSTFSTRPHVKQFLEYCLSNHYVLIWSSARPENVRDIVQKLLPSDALLALKESKPDRRLLGVWGRDRLGLNASEYVNKVQVYKRLETVWKDELVNVPDAPEATRDWPMWDQSNTVLVDDSHVKASAQPHNLVQVSEFFGKTDPGESPILSQVMVYIDHLSYQSDVSAYMRVEPFKISGAVSESGSASF